MNRLKALKLTIVIGLLVLFLPTTSKAVNTKVIAQKMDELMFS